MLLISTSYCIIVASYIALVSPPPSHNFRLTLILNLILILTLTLLPLPKGPSVHPQPHRECLPSSPQQTPNYGIKHMILKLKTDIRSLGMMGFIGLQRRFRAIDRDNTKSLSLSDFKKVRVAFFLSMLLFSLSSFFPSCTMTSFLLVYLTILKFSYLLDVALDK
jgi:hypothetical protein